MIDGCDADIAGSFVASEKKSQVLPYMPEARRKFVHDLASVYRMDTQMVDQEPRRRYAYPPALYHFIP